jgi:predicted Zn-dependent protease
MVRQLSRGLTMAAALGLVGIRSSTLNRWLLGDLQQLRMLANTRDAEREADATAAQAAQGLYGHTGGLERLFQRFGQIQQEHGGGAASEWTAFLQSHPLPQERERAAHGAGAPPKLTPLDPVFKNAGGDGAPAQKP